MKSRYFLIIQPSLCLLAASALLTSCMNIDDKINLIREPEPEPGDVVVPLDPNEIPEQGTTKPEGSGGIIPSDPDDPGTGSGQTGNGSINSEELTLEIVSPSKGSTRGGYEVRIRGTLLDESGVVKFGALDSPKQTYVNKNVVRAVVPAGNPGCVDVTWTQDDKTLTLKKGFCYIDPIQIDQIQPDIAVQNKITEVTIQGKGFDKNTRVYFESEGKNLALVDPVIDSDQQLHGFLPMLNTGMAKVIISNASGYESISEGIQVIPDIAVNDITPAAIPSETTRTVQLAGSGFDDTLKVRVGSVVLAPTVSAPNSMSFQAPALPTGSYDLVVYDTLRQTRLESALHYYSDSATPQILAASPAYGSAAGGDSVKIYGSQMPVTGSVLLGTQTATIQQKTSTEYQITTPSSSPGTVDITLGSLKLKNGFEFLPNFSLTSLSPSTGSSEGGYTVEMAGSGFTKDLRVFFGPMESPEVKVNSAGKLSVQAPPGMGNTPIHFVYHGHEILTTKTFTYTPKVEITGLSPAESVVTGQTPIQIFGNGFEQDVKLYVDGTSVPFTLVAGNVMTFVAPNHSQGKATVSLKTTDGTVLATTTLNYYNASGGVTGASGSTIDGVLHVTVLTVGDAAPIEGATVYIGSDPATALKGTTDAYGRVSFFDDRLSGSQIVIACAPEHSCNTMQPVNAQNVTLLLEDWHANDENTDPENPPPPPPPPDDIDMGAVESIDVTIPYTPQQPYLTGKVIGMGKIDLDVHPDYERVAFVKQSTLGTYDFTYDDEEEVYLINNEDGPYKLKARKGEVAIAAICGLYNKKISDFIPKYMGIVRHQMVTDGVTLRNNIECNIPLNRNQSIKMIDPPLHSGPDIVMAHGYIFLGNEGYIGGTIGGWLEGFMNGHSSTELVVATRLPAEREILKDMQMAYVVGAYTLVNPASGSLAYRSPATVFYSYNNDPAKPLIEVGPAAPIPVFVTPNTEDILSTGRLAWTVEYPQNVDFYALTIRMYSSKNPVLLWQFYLPGSATTAEFPVVHKWPEDHSGQLYVQLIAYRSIRKGFDFNLFSTAELRSNYIDSSATSTLVIRDPNYGKKP